MNDECVMLNMKHNSRCDTLHLSFLHNTNPFVPSRSRDITDKNRTRSVRRRTGGTAVLNLNPPDLVLLQQYQQKQLSFFFFIFLSFSGFYQAQFVKFLTFHSLSLSRSGIININKHSLIKPYLPG